MAERFQHKGAPGISPRGLAYIAFGGPSVCRLGQGKIAGFPDELEVVLDPIQ